jgi:hypothetical protein
VRCFVACTAGVPALLNGNNSDVQRNVKSNPHGSMKHFTGPLNFLDGKYEQDNFSGMLNDSFVIPQSINFGMRLESRCVKNETVYDTYEYLRVGSAVSDGTC